MTRQTAKGLKKNLRNSQLTELRLKKDEREELGHWLSAQVMPMQKDFFSRMKKVYVQNLLCCQLSYCGISTGVMLSLHKLHIGLHTYIH